MNEPRPHHRRPQDALERLIRAGFGAVIARLERLTERVERLEEALAAHGIDVPAEQTAPPTVGGGSLEVAPPAGHDASAPEPASAPFPVAPDLAPRPPERRSIDESLVWGPRDEPAAPTQVDVTEGEDAPDD